VTTDGRVRREQSVGGGNHPSGRIDGSPHRGQIIGVAAHGLVRVKYRIQEDDGASVIQQSAALIGAASGDGQISKREVDVGLNEQYA
jgi:hypothetical protein